MKVYKYRLGEPLENRKTLFDQIHLAHRYRNALTEIERSRRAKIRAVQEKVVTVADAIAPIKAISTELEAIDAKIKGGRQKDRKRTKVPPELKERKKELTEQRKVLNAELKATKNAEAKVLRPLYAQIGKETHAAQLAARKKFSAQGLYWGTYQLVEKAIEQASEDAPTLSVKDDPPFRRWDKTGTVSVQIQHGLDAEDIFVGQNGKTNTQIQIDPIDKGAWYHEKRGERRKRMRTQMRIRIGSQANGRPIWMGFHLVMHRPLPKESVIKRVSVVVRRVGEKLHYFLNISVDEAKATLTIPPNREKALGLDVGWRKVDGGLRIARWVGSDGKTDELILPDRVINGLRKVEDLRSIRDTRKDAMVPMLAGWLKANPVPIWLADETKTIAKWKSPKRFLNLWTMWQEFRFKGDEEIFAMLNAWATKERHLLAWEANSRDKLETHRRELYRIFAAKLATKYEWLGLEDFDLRKTSKKAPTEADDNVPSNLIYAQKTAAISILRDALVNAFHGRCGGVIKVPAPNTTRECNQCHTINLWDQAKILVRKCQACGAVWDQDENAAENILARTLVVVASGKAKKKDRKAKSGRWQRRKKKKNDRSQTVSQPDEIA